MDHTAMSLTSSAGISSLQPRAQEMSSGILAVQSIKGQLGGPVDSPKLNPVTQDPTYENVQRTLLPC